jgi:hypothetical protein
MPDLADDLLFANASRSALADGLKWKRAAMGAGGERRGPPGPISNSTSLCRRNRKWRPGSVAGRNTGVGATIGCKRICTTLISCLKFITLLMFAAVMEADHVQL